MTQQGAEPIRCWVTVDRDGAVTGHFWDESSAKQLAANHPGWRVVELVEVQP